MENTIVLNKLNNNSAKNLIESWSEASSLTNNVAGVTSNAVSVNNAQLVDNSVYTTPMPQSVAGNSEYGSYGSGNSSTSFVMSSGYSYSYPYTWISYTYPGADVTDKVLITKAENGFILVYNGKSYIARTEVIVSKLLVKILSNKGEK